MPVNVSDHTGNILEEELIGRDIRIPHMTIDGNTLSYYDKNGELLWKVDDIGIYTTQSVSSATYPVRNYRINNEEQPDIKDEQGGSLDEFLESFRRY